MGTGWGKLEQLVDDAMGLAGFTGFQVVEGKLEIRHGWGSPGGEGVDRWGREGTALHG